MPTLLRDLLKTYSEQDLEKFARDKIENFEHLRLPKSVLIEELSNHLTSPSFIYDSIAFRSPPSFEILSLLLNNKGYESTIVGFRKRVLENTKEIIEKSNSGEFLEKDQNFSLYLKILQSAWESNEKIERSEAKLLESLREELGITFKEHCILEHHPNINQYWNEGNPFQRERNHLLQAGIIYVNEENDNYILPEEIAYQILQLWEIELDDYDYQRLLDKIQKNSLSNILNYYNLKVSGVKDELITRIVKNHIPARKVLNLLQKEELSDICKSIDCKSSGLKQDLIDRLISNFRYDLDLELEEDSKEEEEEIIEEEKELIENHFKKLFNVFTTNELQYLLSKVPTLVTYGTKDEKVNRLWTGPFSERSLLDLLTKRELKKACEEFGLLVSGRKEDLVDRILIHFADEDELQDGIEEELSQQKQLEEKVDQQANSFDNLETEIPHFNEIKEKFPFLDTNQQTILASLIEFKSLNEQDIDRIVARYNLGWLFYKPEMNRLIDQLSDNGFDVIEKHSFGETDRYDLRYGQDIL